MKHLILFGSLSLFLISCTSNTDKQNATNIALINNYIKAVEELDYNSMDSLLADNYVGLGPSRTDTINKAGAIAAWKTNVVNLYSKIHYNRSRTVSVMIPDGENKGEWVVNWAELNIVYKHNNEEVTIWANTNYMIENGKIIKSLTVYNEADALRQLGYKIVSPVSTE